MRTTALLILAAIFTASTVGVGCAADTADGLSQSRRSPKKSAKDTSSTTDDSDDEDVDHDPSDIEGETQADQSNPNANTTPNAPATPGQAAAEFGITLANATPTVDLGDSVEIAATIEPKNGFTGAVDVAVSGLPQGVTASPVTATVNGQTQTKITLKADLSAAVTANDVPLTITAKSGGITATANANFKVAPRLTITIPMNVDALRGATQIRNDYYAPNTQQAVKTQAGNGVVVQIFNADSKPHIIHGPGGAFPHGNTGAPIQPNAFEMNNGQIRTRTLNAGANVTAYLHDGNQGQGASFRIQVAAQ